MNAEQLNSFLNKEYQNYLADVAALRFLGHDLTPMSFKRFSKKRMQMTADQTVKFCQDVSRLAEQANEKTVH